MDLVETTDQPTVRHPWETARLRIVKQLISQRTLPQHGCTIVDIGCGDAFVALDLAEEYPSCRVIGIDDGFTPSDIARLNTQGVSGRIRFFRSLSDTVSHCGAEALPASLILLMDVLEHVEDDGVFLREIISSGLMGPQTRLIVTVPAYQWLWSAHDVFLRHQRRYTRSRLEKRLTEVRLHAEQSGYFFSSLVPLRLLSLIVAKVLGDPSEPRSELRPVPGGRLGAGLLSQLLFADASVSLALARIGVVLPGLSAYAICRRSA